MSKVAANFRRSAKDSKNNPPCIECGEPTRITETYPVKDAGFRLRRRYQCKVTPSHVAFTTDETYSIRTPVVVLKSDGRPPEPFDLLQLMEGLKMSATPEEKAYRIFKLAKTIADRVIAVAETNWRALSQDQRSTLPIRSPVIKSHEIGEVVLEVLKAENLKTMWIRFALVFFKLDSRTAMDSVFRELEKRWDAHNGFARK